MTFQEFLECVKRAGLEGKFQYKEEWFDWDKKKIKFLSEDGEEITQGLFKHLYEGYPEKYRKSKKLNKEEFIRRSIIFYGDKYTYDNLNYINNRTKIKINCRIHGEITVIPDNHLRGHGCKYCAFEKNANDNRKKLDDFIKEAQEIHQNKDGTPKYDYSNVNYVNNDTNVKIICKKHGNFWITPRSHLNGCGCTKCGYESSSKKQQMAKYEFIIKANEIFNSKYIYTKTDLANRDEKGRVCIICPIHGEFWITPGSHLSGRGCAQCNESHIERNLYNMLNVANIIYSRYAKFNWLSYKNEQNLDFFLDDYNIGIECQGKQHFQSIEHFGGEKNFEYTIERDINKFKLCQENGVKLLYLFPKEKVDFSKVNEQFEIYKPNENIFYSPEELIEYIKTQPKIKT